MKKFLIFLLVVICCAAAVFFVTRKQTPVTLSFDGQQYTLQYSVNNEDGWFNQYFLPEQDASNYRYMLTVRAYDNTDQEPQQIGSNILEKLLENYSDAKYSFFPWQNDSFCLYFILPTDDAFELHLLRFSKQLNGKPLEIQMVYRIPFDGDEQQAWQQMSTALDKDLSRWIPLMMTMPLPEVVRQARN